MSKLDDRKHLYEGHGGSILSASEWVKQNEVNENRERTQARSCYTKCRTCGHCSMSRRGCAAPYSYDANAQKKINCIGCEQNGFCDCVNGFLRDTYNRAEPFTDAQISLIESSETGRPLI